MASTSQRHGRCSMLQISTPLVHYCTAVWENVGVVEPHNSNNRCGAYVRLSHCITAGMSLMAQDNNQVANLGIKVYIWVIHMHRRKVKCAMTCLSRLICNLEFAASFAGFG